MSITVRVERIIGVPVDIAFSAISEIERLPDHNPDVVAVEFLTEQREGVGTRFRETRRMGKRELVTELEVVEYDREIGMVRMVADTHGTIWDTRMSATPASEGCRVLFEMDARGSTWAKRAMNWLMQGFFRKGIEKHVAQLGARLEARAG